ncbi:hypothetical protein OGATHE_006447 [Ogataea polymorpha]|uniref:Uncharacterized protein n=1 Tax=Ogataea polymorpha TaxID=460523 RepID=A0A9P8NR67_9ASCO|nr:hypothetical protein OGATHE_006447 [Ogataea polymorpha]
MSIRQLLDTIESRILVLETLYEGSSNVCGQLQRVLQQFQGLLAEHADLMRVLEQAQTQGLLAIRPVSHDDTMSVEEKYRLVVASLQEMEHQVNKLDELQLRLQQWDDLMSDAKTRTAAAKLMVFDKRNVAEVMDALVALKERFYAAVLRSNWLMRTYMVDTFEQATFYLEVETKLRRYTQLVEQKQDDQLVLAVVLAGNIPHTFHLRIALRQRDPGPLAYGAVPEPVVSAPNSAVCRDDVSRVWWQELIEKIFEVAVLRDKAQPLRVALVLGDQTMLLSQLSDLWLGIVANRHQDFAEHGLRHLAEICPVTSHQLSCGIFMDRCSIILPNLTYLLHPTSGFGVRPLRYISSMGSKTSDQYSFSKFTRSQGIPIWSQIVCTSSQSLSTVHFDTPPLESGDQFAIKMPLTFLYCLAYISAATEESTPDDIETTIWSFGWGTGWT